MSLTGLLCRATERWPDRVAVRALGAEITYRQLDALANRCARALAACGVRRGERVAIWLPKSIGAVAAMQGALRLGAAYVPCDPLSPPARVKAILRDCDVRALVSTRARAEKVLLDELASVPCLAADESEADPLWDRLPANDDPLPDPGSGPDELAYILYTSGSTGVPKGVCISHRGALSFVEWSAEVIDARLDDRFASHAPFHFDLSVFDLYVPMLVGGSVSLLRDEAGYAPRQLVDFIASERITVWYSVPTALTMMADRGGLLETPTPPRVVCFAGEPFPIKHLRRLRRAWPSVRLFNLYGPTETNVCTYHEVHEIGDEETAPVPIGRAAAGDTVWAVRPDGQEAEIGEEGELLVTGPTVMLGYWGQQLTPGRQHATGDIVRRLDRDSYTYVGRRDHMVKVRGHRIELGDVEAALMTHPAVHEAAVVVAGSGMTAQLVAFVVCKGEPPSLLDLKRHTAERLPRYMIVGAVRPVPELPRTRNGKIDRTELTKVVRESAEEALGHDA